MLILLPPSERKELGTLKSGVALETLSFSDYLTPTRKLVIANQNPDLFGLPTSPAIEIYSGVLYKSLNYDALSLAAKQQANGRLLIFSALFGVLRPMDQIPKYSAKIRNSEWKKPLSAALDGLQNQLIIDCRSSTYAAGWKSNSADSVSVRVFEHQSGRRRVVTHMSKKYRGALARIVVENEELHTPRELLSLASRHFEAELHAPTLGRPWLLDLFV